MVSSEKRTILTLRQQTRRFAVEYVHLILLYQDLAIRNNAVV